MLRVGLTGGIACGKSTIAEMFSNLGVHVILADKVAHELYRKGEPVYDELVRRFGQGIVGRDGEIDRALLAKAAFEGGRVEELNGIVHPAVIRRQEQMIEQIISREPNAVIMVEAALILEAGLKDKFAKLIVVTCQPEQKVSRYAQRAGLNAASAKTEVERRSKAQLPDDEKVRSAHYVIDNSGSLDQARRQVEGIYSELRAQAMAAR
ncbi:MAG TPA: dephospho-CoA kinase [Candidatus Angelobacter sp.]|nr:dephospho-CoA kinase [Candidatus Angelobacter sp.]